MNTETELSHRQEGGHAPNLLEEYGSAIPFPYLLFGLDLQKCERMFLTVVSGVTYIYYYYIIL